MIRSSLVVVASSMLLCAPLPAGEDVLAKLAKAEKAFDEAKEKARLAYRKEFAEAIALADKVEVYLLDFEPEKTPSDFYHWETRLEEGEFPVIPYGMKTKILKSVVLTAEQKKEFMPELRQQLGFQGEYHGGADCHFPIHGVRISSGDSILYQSTFCWHCGNFSLTYPDGSGWAGLQGKSIAEAFKKVMPIPQSEIDRFDAAYGNKNKPAEKKAGEDKK